MFKQSYVTSIFSNISIFYLYLCTAIIVGASSLHSVPVRTANFDLPVCRSYFLTGPFFSGIDHLKFITVTRKLTNQMSYEFQFAIIIYKCEGQQCNCQNINENQDSPSLNILIYLIHLF